MVTKGISYSASHLVDEIVHNRNQFEFALACFYLGNEAEKALYCSVQIGIEVIRIEFHVANI